MNNADRMGGNTAWRELGPTVSVEEPKEKLVIKVDISTHRENMEAFRQAHPYVLREAEPARRFSTIIGAAITARLNKVRAGFMNERTGQRWTWDDVIAVTRDRL